MTFFLKNFLTLISILLLLSCARSKKQSSEVDDKSYITDFELIQRNIRNNTTIKINSPKAIIDQSNNDFEIFNSSIELSNKAGINLQIESGRSTLNNSDNIISVFENVNIFQKNNLNSFIKTDSFEWDLNRSTMNLNSPLEVNFKNTRILSESGIYNIDGNQLKLNNNTFKRNVFNLNGNKKYKIEIVSDIAMWSKQDNSFEFKSIDKQVVSKFDLLRTENIK